MAKKAHFKYKEEFRDMSGKNNTPGQYRLDLDEEKLGLIEQKPQLCKPYYAQKYWEAFREFLDASGVFNRTWYLYKQIEKDPSPEELNEKIDEATRNGGTREYIDKLKSQLDDVVKRLAVMHSETGMQYKKSFSEKLKKEWKDYKAKLKNLIFTPEKPMFQLPQKRTARTKANAKVFAECFTHLYYSTTLLEARVDANIIARNMSTQPRRGVRKSDIPTPSLSTPSKKTIKPTRNGRRNTCVGRRKSSQITTLRLRKFRGLFPLEKNRSL